MRFEPKGPAKPASHAEELFPAVITVEQTPLATTTELATIKAVDSIVPSEFFKPGGSADVLARLKDEVRRQAAELDVATEESRKALASLAYKIAKSKTALDDAGKKLVADQKTAIKAIDAERSKVWDEMEELQKEVRAPLTAWEQKEKDRVAGHLTAIEAIVNEGVLRPGSGSVVIVEQLTRIQAMLDRDFQDFDHRAAVAAKTAIENLVPAFEAAKKAEADAAELERLRAKAEARREQDRLDAVAKEAREAAERIAREREAEILREAEAERQRVENERNEAEARAKQAEARRIAEQQQAERERKQAEADAIETVARLAREKKVALEDAERRRVADAEQADRRAKAAAEQAELDRIAAVDAERKLVADAAKRQREDREARERDQKHRDGIDDTAVLALVFRCAIPKDAAEAVVRAIGAGLIPNTRIEY